MLVYRSVFLKTSENRGFLPWVDPRFMDSANEVSWKFPTFKSSVQCPFCCLIVLAGKSGMLAMMCLCSWVVNRTLKTKII